MSNTDPKFDLKLRHIVGKLSCPFLCKLPTYDFITARSLRLSFGGECSRSLAPLTGSRRTSTTCIRLSLTISQESWPRPWDLLQARGSLALLANTVAACSQETTCKRRWTPSTRGLVCLTHLALFRAGAGQVLEVWRILEKEMSNAKLGWVVFDCSPVAKWFRTQCLNHNTLSPKG